MVDVEAFLKHYASQYYDPQKAHDYYMRNRHLKGRRKGSSLTKQVQTKQINGTSSNVGQQRSSNNQPITKKNAAETQKRINEKLKKLAKIMDQREYNLDTDTSINPKVRAFLQGNINRRKQFEAQKLQDRRDKIAKDLKAALKNAKDRHNAVKQKHG